MFFLELRKTRIQPWAPSLHGSGQLCSESDITDQHRDTAINYRAGSRNLKLGPLANLQMSETGRGKAIPIFIQRES
jgi:hypothetical protein